jgi:hypothetical protein
MLALVLIIFINGVLASTTVTVPASLSGYSQRVLTETTSESYSSITSGLGNGKNTTSDTVTYIYLVTNATNGALYKTNNHPEIRFQIPSGVKIASGTLALTGGTKSNTFAGTAWELVLGNCSWKLPSNIDASDYQNVSRIQMNSANISYASLTSTAPYQNNLTLNPAAIQYLNDHVGGQVCLAPMTSWDFNEVVGGTPAAGKTTQFNINGSKNLVYPPVLDITYTVATFTSNISFSYKKDQAFAFTDTSVDSPSTWAWAFGDGTTSTEPNPIHIYNNYGIFMVSLVTDKGSATHNVQVMAYPVVISSFTKSTAYFNTGSGRVRTVNFSASDPNSTSCNWTAINQTVYIGSQPGGNGTEFIFNTTSCSPQQNFGSGNWSVKVNVTNTTTGDYNLSSPQIMKGLSLAGHVFNTGTDHIYNYDISGMPLDPKSSTFITSIGGPTSWLAPDLYPNLNLVDTQTPTTTLGYSEYTWTNPFYGPIPFSDGWLINDFDTGTDYCTVGGSDCGFNFINVETGNYYEGWRASHNITAGGWDAKTSVNGVTNDYTLRGTGMTGYGLSGLKETPLIVTYDELAADNISHALAMLVNYPRDRNTYVWPVNVPGVTANPNYPPLGTRWRLNASKDISGCTAQAQTILKAQKKYGMFIVDQTGTCTAGVNCYISFMVERPSGVGSTAFSGFGTSAFACVNASDYEAIDESILKSNITSAQVDTTPPTPGFIVTIPATYSDSGSLANYTFTNGQWKTNGSAIEHIAGTTSALINTKPYSDGTIEFDYKRLNADDGSYSRGQFVFGADNSSPIQYDGRNQYTVILQRLMTNTSQTGFYVGSLYYTSSDLNASWFNITFSPFTHVKIVWDHTSATPVRVYLDSILTEVSYDITIASGYMGFAFGDAAKQSQFSNFTFIGTTPANPGTVLPYSTPINLIDASTGKPVTTWNWTDNSVVFNQTQYPTNIILATGNHSIRLNTSNQFGFALSDPVWVNVSAYLWDFGDGTTSGDRNASHTYTAPGTYTINFTVCNTNGCDTKSRVAYITASDVSTPVASFTKNRVITRIPQPVIVTDTSTNTPTSWNWRWGDGTANATTATASHSYRRFGFFPINLESCNAAGCSDTAQWVFAFP